MGDYICTRREHGQSGYPASFVARVESLSHEIDRHLALHSSKSWAGGFSTEYSRLARTCSRSNGLDDDSLRPSRPPLSSIGKADLASLKNLGTLNLCRKAH